MENPVFELKNISFSYLGRYPALRELSMAIRRGEKIAIIGANGSGKSTLLQVLDGLLFPDSGEISFFGRKIRESDFNDLSFSESFRRKVGFVFQNPDIQLFCPTVKEDIVFGPLQLGMDKEQVNKRCEELAGLLGIEGLLERSPHQLSIGEKRKVAIASTLVIDPDILLLDEPTAGLDPLTTRHIIDLLLDANSSGKTIVTSTHDLHIVEEISDSVYVFGREKKIARYGSTNEVLLDTQLLQENNLIHIHRHRHKGGAHIHPHRHSDHHHGE